MGNIQPVSPTTSSNLGRDRWYFGWFNSLVLSNVEPRTLPVSWTSLAYDFSGLLRLWNLQIFSSSSSFFFLFILFVFFSPTTPRRHESSIAVSDMEHNEKPVVERVPVVGSGDVDSDQDHPPHHGMTAGQYITTRFSSLKPPMTKAPNPIRLIRMLNGRQWAFFTVAFIAWTWGAYFTFSLISTATARFVFTGELTITPKIADAFDFFTVSLVVSDLAETFDKSNTDIVRISLKGPLYGHHVLIESPDLGYHPGFDVQVRWIHSLRHRCGSVRSKMALHREQFALHYS